MEKPPQTRPYLSLLFQCCNVYQRVYRHPSATHYQSRCPRCLRPVRLAVGPGGTTARFFTVK